MYKAKVNASYEFEINTDAVEQLDAVETSKNQYHILHDNASIKAKILDTDFNDKRYRIKVNNNIYEVKISDALDQQITAMGFAIGTAKKVNNIKAPMPGLILEINVSVGQDVKEDDPLLILEAMKMENVINSPREGVIKSIEVKQGDTVEKNSLLIEFE